MSAGLKSKLRFNESVSLPIPWYKPQSKRILNPLSVLIICLLPVTVSVAPENFICINKANLQTKWME